MQLNELFDKPYSYHWIKKGNDPDGDWKAEAKLNGGGVIHINFAPTNLDSTAWEINFQRNGSEDFSATGKRDEFKIFSTVAAAIKEWFNWQQKNRHPNETIQEIYFAADKEDTPNSGSRVKLYDRFAKKFAEMANMNVTRSEMKMAVDWTFKRKKKKRRPVEERVGSSNLYHNTDLYSLINIFKDGYIGQDSRTVSLTRNRRYDSAPGAGLSGQEVRFVFDRDELQNKYKIKPHADRSVVKNRFDDTRVKGGEARWESEERVTGKISLNDVERIEVTPKTIAKLENLKESIKKNIDHGLERIKRLKKNEFWHQSRQEWRPIENERQRRHHQGSESKIKNLIKKNQNQLDLITNVLRSVIEVNSFNEEAAGVGRITKQNTTVDVKPGETRRQSAKFGNKVNSKNEPPLLHKKAKKNTNAHVLTNLGLAESGYPIADPNDWYGDLQYKEQGARMIMMDPDKYLKKVRPLSMDDESIENIDILAQHILDGGTLDPLKIYPDGKEDGRHRAYAAKKLGIKKVPVIVWPDNKMQESIITIDTDKDNKFGIDLKPHKLDGKKIGKIGAFEIWFKQDHPYFNGLDTAQIYDPGTQELAGIIGMSTPVRYNFGDKTYITTIAVVNENYEGRGLVFATYKYLIKKGFNLVSDDTQSQGGMGIWKKLAKTPGIHVYAVDLNRGKDPQFHAVDPDDITDSGVIVYNRESRAKYNNLRDEHYKLKHKISSNLGWLEDMKIDQEEGHDVDQQEIADVKDWIGAAKKELAAIEAEMDAYDDIPEYEDVRLMAVSEKKKVKESIKKPHPKHTLGIKRKDMPQVHKDHYPELIKYLEGHGGKFRHYRVPATSLRPVQSEFSDEGVEKMIKKKSGDSGTTRDKPLIVSKDNYIIDGHHRWLAAYNLDETIPIMQISIPVKKLFKLVKDFKHTTYKDIYESQLNELFNEKYNWQWTQGSTRTKMAEFQTEQGDTVTVFFERLSPQSPNYEVGFKTNGEIKRTGGGDQFKIISTVIDVIKDFMDKNTDTEVLTFTAKREGRELESRKIKNRRAELYRRMLGRYADSMGYEFADEDIGRMTEFVLRRKQPRNKMEEACIQGGHVYEQDLDEIHTINDLKNDEANIARSDQRLQLIKDGELIKIKDLGDVAIYGAKDLVRYGMEGYVMVADRDLENLIAFLRLQHTDHKIQPTMKAGMAWTNPKYRRQGYATAMYESLLERGINISADMEQTRKSKMVWQALIQKHKAYLLRDGEIDQEMNNQAFKTAYKKNAPYNYTILLASPKAKIGENISITGTQRKKQERKKKLQPGSDAWFKHWFSRPYLRREQVEQLKTEAVQYLRKKKGVRNEKTTNRRRSNSNRRANERRCT